MIYFLGKNINLDLHPFKNFKLLFKEYPYSVLWTQWTPKINLEKLKEDGRNYTNEKFLRLLQLISRENIIQISKGSDKPISSVSKLINLLESIYDENDETEIPEQSLRNLIYKAINTFNTATEENNKEVRELNNYLLKILELIYYVQKIIKTKKIYLLKLQKIHIKIFT